MQISYDGLLDITHGCTGVTVTNSFVRIKNASSINALNAHLFLPKLHDHWKASLVGHSDNNGDEDKALRVTYASNYW